MTVFDTDLRRSRGSFPIASLGCLTVDRRLTQVLQVTAAEPVGQESQECTWHKVIADQTPNNSYDYFAVFRPEGRTTHEHTSKLTFPLHNYTHTHAHTHTHTHTHTHSVYLLESSLGIGLLQGSLLLVMNSHDLNGALGSSRMWRTQKA